VSILELDISFRLRADEVLELVDVAAGDRVVDLGCATGALALRLAGLGATVTAVDADPDNLAPLKGRELIVPVHARIEELPFADGAFQAAFCLETLEHIDDDAGAVAEAARVLEPGAPLVVTVPNVDAPPPLAERLGVSTVHDEEGLERHVRPGYTREQLASLLTGGGFEVECLFAVGGAPYRAVAGTVSLAHLAYRRARGQRSWSWADVERAQGSLPLRAYRRTLPLARAVSRVNRYGPRGSTLVARARKAA
jgi:SAM-dependent methyltransferase